MITNNSDFTILVVDDEPDLREIIQTDIQSFGYQCLTAINAPDALEVLKNTKVDLILSDQNMPGGNGDELLRAVKQSTPTLPFVLFLTAAGALEEYEAYELGCESILYKPFTEKELSELLWRLLAPLEEKWTDNQWQEETLKELSENLLEPQDLFISDKTLLGHGGLRWCLPSPISVKNDEIIRFKIQFESHSPDLSGIGQIHWAEPHPSDTDLTYIGLEIKYLGAPAKEELLKLLKKNRPKAFIPGPK